MAARASRRMGFDLWRMDHPRKAGVGWQARWFRGDALEPKGLASVGAGQPRAAGLGQVREITHPTGERCVRFAFGVWRTRATRGLFLETKGLWGGVKSLLGNWGSL